MKEQGERKKEHLICDEFLKLFPAKRLEPTKQKKRKRKKKKYIYIYI